MFCPKCGKDIGEAKYCPHCGSAVEQGEDVKGLPAVGRKSSKKRGCLASVMIFLIFVFFSFAIILNSETNLNVDEPAGTEENQSLQDLELVDHSTESDGGLRYVVGHIKNNTEKTYAYVQVSINLYNDGTQVGSTLANVNNLEPGGTWEFKALISQDSATEYKIADISGW